MTNSTYSIAVVGVGACGASLFYELVMLHQNSEVKPIVHLIECDDQMARGLAFGTNQSGQLLNTEASLMGIVPDEPSHFNNWLKNHPDILEKSPSADQAFYPQRLDYRKYLQDVLDSALAVAKSSGISVHKHHSEAINIKPSDNCSEITLANESKITANATVLCIGTPKPKRFKNLIGQPGYVDFPWPAENITRTVSKDAPVAILGSSLSAIDSFFALIKNGHKGEIHFCSPSGIMPCVEIPGQPAVERKYFTYEKAHRLFCEKGTRFSVFDLFRLFRCEVEELVGKKVDWRSLDRAGKDAKVRFIEDTEKARQGNEPLQRVLTSARHDACAMWSLLNEREREKFTQFFGENFSAARFCTPLVNAERLSEAFKEGQLFAHGDIDETVYDEEQKAFKVKFHNKNPMYFPYVVNATGTAMKLKEMPGQLIAQLCEDGHLIDHPSGGARASNKELLLEQNASIPIPNFYGIGQLLNGVLRDTNAVWFNAKCAGSVARSIAYDIASRNRKHVYKNNQ